jgi:glucose-1-phosphate thymidylyltransferase
MFAGIREILIITTPQDQPLFQRLLGDGSELGLSISSPRRNRPRGLADAFIIGRDFIGKDCVALILGDNIFYGHGLPEQLLKAGRPPQRRDGVRICGQHPCSNTGWWNSTITGRALSIEEKPEIPNRNSP